MNQPEEDTTISYHLMNKTIQANIYAACYLMTHKYRGCIAVLSINKSVEPNEEQKVLASNLDQEFTVKTSRQEIGRASCRERV